MATDFENSVGFDTAWANYTDPFDSQTYDPAGPLNSDFMNWVFGHILDWTPQERAPHLQWWTNQLDTSAWTRGQVLSYFSDYADARSNPNIGGTDATTPPPAATNNGNTDVAQDLTYLIDVEGIVVRVHDTSAGIDQYACYGYNTRYELTSAYTRGDGSCAGSDSTGPDPYSVTYAYNSQGNITSATGTNTPGGSYTYGAGTAGPHAVTAAGTRTFGYDNAGNMTSRTTHTGGNQALTYTLQNRLKTITGAGTTMTVLYDAEGNRVKRTLNGTTTYSLGETYETDGTTATIHHRLGKHIGTTIGTAFTAVATDHLGSPTLSRDTTGTTTTTRFQPYGQTRGQTTPTLTGQPFDLTFTGQTNDPGTGLYDYNARHYDPTLARFAMADPILDNTNRYTYVGNNPIRYTDPTGNEVLADGGQRTCTSANGGGCDSRSAGSGRHGTIFGHDANGIYESWKRPYLGGDHSPDTRTGVRFWLNVASLFPGIDIWADSALCGDSIANGTKTDSGFDCAGAGVPGIGAGWITLGRRTGGVLKAVLRGADNAPNSLVNETAGGLTNLGRGSARGPGFFDDFSAGQGFSGVYDDATGSILAFPSGPGGVVPQYGGHGVVSQRLTQAIGAPGGQRAGFTAILQTDGSLAVQWSSRSVNGPGASRFVPESLRPAIIDALTATSGRTVVG